MNAQRRGQRGFSLVELMIGCLLGLVLLAALGQVMLQAARHYREDELRSRTEAEARFALAHLTADLEMAGWWGGLRGPEALRVAASAEGLGGDCALPLAEAVRIVRERMPCISAAEFAGGDIVAVQRIAGEPVLGSLSAGHAYVAIKDARGVLFRFAPGTPPPAGVAYEFQPAIWYLRRYVNSPGDSPRVPALCRKVLSADGARMQADPGGCIAQGVERLELATVASGALTAVQVRLAAHLAESGREYRRDGSMLAVLRNATWQAQPAGLP